MSAGSVSLGRQRMTKNCVLIAGGVLIVTCSPLSFMRKYGTFILYLVIGGIYASLGRVFWVEDACEFA